MWNSPLPVEQAANLLDNAPMAIYVCSLHTYELLYANRMAKKLFFGSADTAGITCYQAAGLLEPCPFCRARELSVDGLLIREFRHPGTHRVYQLSGRAMDWDGKHAHIEYILDITDQKKEEDELKTLNAHLEATFSNLPCGLCVYRFNGTGITPVFNNPAFYDIMGYSDEHIATFQQESAFLNVHPEDLSLLQEKIQEMTGGCGAFQHTYRLWNDRVGEYRWVRLEGSAKKNSDDSKFLYGVYTDVSNQVCMERKLAETGERMRDIINAIPGGIASYQIEGNRLIPTYFSDGVAALSGHTREEYTELTRETALNAVYELDRERVLAAVKDAVHSGKQVELFYRMRHKDGGLIWIRLNGRRMGPCSDVNRFYVVFTGMSAEARLFQTIANETADGIYVIDKSNYDLLYINESKLLFAGSKNCTGQKCYEVLHGKSAPCAFCTLRDHAQDGLEHELPVDHTGSYYSIRFRETDWNGIPAYIKYVRDVTIEVQTRKEKERLEQYFQTVVKNLPGGVAVVRYDSNGGMTPEFLSDRFADMTGMTTEEAWELYKENAMAGVHPDDQASVRAQMNHYIASGENHCEIVYRLKKGDGDYLWVKNTLSLIRNEGEENRVYAFYHDMTKEREEQERIRQQYNDLILQHYRASDPNDLVVGHCNITKNLILEIIDHTDAGLLDTFGAVREGFFTGLSSLILDEESAAPS